MCVTFHIPAAPRDAAIVACDFPGCREGARCGYCVDGLDVEDTSEAPSCNFANANAAALLALLGQGNGDFDNADDGIYGCWRLDSLPIVRRAIMVAKARAGSRVHMVREASESQVTRVVNGGPKGYIIERGPLVIDCGNTDDQTLRRLDNLEDVVVYAQEHGWEVHWG